VAGTLVGSFAGQHLYHKAHLREVKHHSRCLSRREEEPEVIWEPAMMFRD
jgi:hypothetical protein